MKMWKIVATMNTTWAVGLYHAGTQSDFCNVICGINDLHSFNFFCKTQNVWRWYDSYLIFGKPMSEIWYEFNPVSADSKQINSKCNEI